MKAICKYLLSVLICLCAALNLSAQSVSYTFKPFGTQGGRMSFTVAKSKQDATCYIVVNVSTERLFFLNNPTMKLTTFNDETLSFKGQLVGNDTNPTLALRFYFVFPMTKINSTAIFPVTPEEFEKINSGVSQIFLSTTPLQHEKTFKKDKIGKKLYEFYSKMKDE